MKAVIIAAAAAAALSLGACASTPPGEAFDPAGTAFTGFVRVTEGEFQLYPREAQLRSPFARPCVSGVLPLNEQRTARELSGRKVTFTGRAVRWPGGVALEHEGSTVRNTCGGDHVILAQSVSVLR
ncbi:hypothetical protein [Brevundimonas sp.]|uniref:hypothetical protein n=1 Tax=Brevundimonas sp. TaxID=1871086 RepID=UPI002FC69E1C